MQIKAILFGLIFFWSSMGFCQMKEAPLHDMAQSQGFFFFYNASCPHCQQFAPILKKVSAQYGFSVVAISGDGGFLTSFPDAVMDEGQAKMFQVSVYPTLFLVDPKNQKASLVTEGAISEEEVLQRLIKISQGNDTKDSL